MTNIEKNMSEKIDSLENRLETKLIAKLDAIVDDKVTRKVQDITSEITNKMSEVLTETQTWKEEKAVVKSDIKDLKEENKCISDTLLQHQKYLESIEASKRASNLIITGLPEDEFTFNDETFRSDEGKVQLILNEIDQPTVGFEECIRLGKLPATHPRVLLVKLRNPQDRKSVLQNAKQLKQKQSPLNKVYMKKDVHPGIRREYERLKKVEKEERNKPENQGKNVVYVKETRQITIDGQVVDSFHVQLF